MGQFATQEEEDRYNEAYFKDKFENHSGVDQTPEELEKRIEELKKQKLRSLFKLSVSLVYKGKLLPKGILSFKATLNHKGMVYTNSIRLNCKHGFTEEVKNGIHDRLIKGIVEKYKIEFPNA